MKNLDQPDIVYFRRFTPVWRWLRALFAIAIAIATMMLVSIGRPSH